MSLLLLQMVGGALLFAFIEKMLLLNLLHILSWNWTNRDVFSGRLSFFRFSFSISQLLRSLDTRLKMRFILRACKQKLLDLTKILTL